FDGAGSTDLVLLDADLVDGADGAVLEVEHGTGCVALQDRQVDVEQHHLLMHWRDGTTKQEALGDGAKLWIGRGDAVRDRRLVVENHLAMTSRAELGAATG